MNDILLVLGVPTIDYDMKLKAKQSIKAGNSLILTVNLTGVPDPSVEWSVNDKAIAEGGRVMIQAGAEFATLTMKNTSREDSGTYRITASNTAGSASAEFTVQIIGRLETTEEIGFWPMSYFMTFSLHLSEEREISDFHVAVLYYWFFF